MEKFNEEFIRKELTNLATEGIDDIIAKLRKSKKFKFSDNDQDGDGSNWLSARISIADNTNDRIESLFSDFYTKKQLTEFEGLDPEKFKLKPINEEPLKHDPRIPVLTDEVTLTKGEIITIINHLYKLTGYQSVLTKSQDEAVVNHIQELTDKVNM